MRREFLYKLIWGAALIAATVLVRVSDHMPNVAPVGAVALWAGAVLPAPWSLVVPLGSMLIADAIIGFAMLPITLAVYLSYGLIVLMGRWLRKRFVAWRIVGSALLGSILFYLITNAAVWWYSGLYERTWDGLLLSYFYAVPFFRNTLFGDVAYTCGLFLAWQLVPVLGASAIKALAARRETMSRAGSE